MTARLRAAVACAAAALAAAALPALSVRHARSALLEVGPNDVEYTSGFRQDWERDGRTRFRWTTLRSAVRLPVRLDGEGHLLRMRVRRHFVEPAVLALRNEGRLVASIVVASEPRVPYRTIEVPLPPQGGRAFQLDIEARTAHPAPLGVAVDWMEVTRTGAFARFGLPGATLVRLAALAGLLTALVLVAGGALPLALASPTALTLAVTWGAWADPVAVERIVRLGAAPLAAVAIITTLLTRSRRVRGWLVIDAAWAPAALVVTVTVALGIRIALLLHPQFFYPDVKVHGLFAWELARRGLGVFLREYQANQFRYSLGLQTVGEHWYAFPYPPGFYALCWPLVRLAGYRAEVAVAIVAAVANALSALLTWGIARRLALPSGAALFAAAAHATLPFFLARLTLAYFPAITGQALDALVLLFVLANVARIHEARRAAVLAGLMTLAFLTYTQSLLNFGVVFALFALLQWTARDGATARRRLARIAALALAGVIAIGASVAIFYHRYVPVIAAMQAGRPVPEERILLELFARRPVDPEAVPEEPDPYAGPDLDAWRGVRKAGWRLFVFYGWFAPLVVLGVSLALRRTAPLVFALALAWALAYLVLNLASGGLPSPNLVRYNKDLELVAPIIGAGLGALAWAARERSRWLAGALAIAWIAFSAVRAVGYLTATFVLER